MADKVLTVTVKFDDSKVRTRERLQEILEEVLYSPEVAMTEPLDAPFGTQYWPGDGTIADWVLTTPNASS